MPERNPRITISAAGQASRIRSWMDEAGYPEGTPKSALMTGAGESLLGRIVRQAMPIGHVAIVGNYKTIEPLAKIDDLPRDVSVELNRNITGPLGPIYLDALRTGRQSYMSAGDYWAEMDWEDMLAFHNSHDNPATIMVAPSIPVPGGARFDVAEDGAVRKWERVEYTSSADLINIGAYIIDGDNPEIMGIVEKLNSTTHKEDPFNDATIGAGILSAYVLSEKAFNVNNGEIYRYLVEHSATRPVAPQLPSTVPIQFIPNAP